MHIGGQHPDGDADSSWEIHMQSENQNRSKDGVQWGVILRHQCKKAIEGKRQKIPTAMGEGEDE